MILILLIIVGVQTAVILALLIQRARLARAERTLREGDERLRDVMERAPVMIWTARTDTTLDYLNGHCAEFTGLPIEKLQNEGWLDIVHPEDLDRLVGTYTPAFEARVPFLAEYRVRRADGVWRWLLASGVPKHAPDGSFAGYIGCDVDITERKNAEDLDRASRAALEVTHLEIQHLAGRLIEAQDAERARIARDLHDDVSQQVAGLSIALSSLKRRMDEQHVSEDLEADLRAIHERTTTLAQDVRHLSHDLHPTVLRHAGLLAALSAHCTQLEESHRTVLTCSADGDFATLSPEVALCLYRIAQEALRNVIAHSGARRAEVRLLRVGEYAEMTISDDGKGFDRAHSLEGGQGLGLVSISERAKLMGGTVEILAEPEMGTQVRVRVPAHPPANRDGSRELSAS